MPPGPPLSVQEEEDGASLRGRDRDGGSDSGGSGGEGSALLVGAPHLHGEWRSEGVITRERAVRTPTEDLLAGLVKRLPEEKDARAFVDLYERLAALFEVRILRGAAPVRELFDTHATFNTDLKAAAPPVAESGETQFDMASGTVIAGQVRGTFRLVEAIHTIAVKSNFEVLSQAIFDFAMEAEFECSIDQKMDPWLLDASLADRVTSVDDFASEFASCSSLCKSMLVYHRGTGVATKKDFFLAEKFDIVLEGIGALALSVVTAPFRLAAAAARLGRSSKGDGGEGNDDASGDAGGGGDSARGGGGGDDGDAVSEEAWIEHLRGKRRSLGGQLLRNPSKFFSSVTLREPTFKEVLLVYRTNAEVERAIAEQRYPQVQVAMFRDIPIADFETILPAQRPVTRAFDILKLLLVFVSVLLYAWRTVEEQLEEEDRDVEDIIEDLIPAVVGLVGYFSKILLNWKKMHAVYVQTITKFLQAHQVAKQGAVLPLLVGEMLSQELKEAMLAYFFLWRSANDTPALLDDECEHHLHSYHGETVDFDVSDAVEKLKELGVVRYKEPLREHTELAYMPVHKAVRQLGNALHHHLMTRNRPCPYCAAGICGAEGEACAEGGDGDDV